MDILSFIVAHLGSFFLFVIIYEAIDQASRCIRKHLEQGTLREQERTEQTRINFLREAAHRSNSGLYEAREALRDLSDEEEDDEEATPLPRVYHGVGRVPNDPQTM
jgi:hypothetical protein